MPATAIPRLTTDRLVLREWLPSDREPFAAMNTDPRVVEHLPSALDRAASDALVDRIERAWAAHGRGLWALARREDGAFLGFVGLHDPSFVAHFAPAVEVGWRIAWEAWGHGYATEGARAALRYAFEALGLAEVVSYTVPANVRSRAVMERLGMSHHERDDFDHPGYLFDQRMRRHVLYRLSRSAWAIEARRVFDTGPPEASA